MVNMSTTNNSDILNLALGNIDKRFREKVITLYLELKHRINKSVHNNEYDAAGLSSGKFCETIFRFLEFELRAGAYTPFNKHINNMTAELAKFELIPKAIGNESLRVIIPRALSLIYTLRNKRGIGHVGGDVEANEIDLTTIVKNADWIIIELIRIYHKLSLEEAQSLVNSINSKSIPDVWEINGKKRILKRGLEYKEKVLLLTYTDIDNGVALEDMFSWTEHSNLSMFKSSVLMPLHKVGLIEFDRELNYIHLSPIGIKEVEEKILSK